MFRQLGLEVTPASCTGELGCGEEQARAALVYGSEAVGPPTRRRTRSCAPCAAADARRTFCRTVSWSTPEPGDPTPQTVNLAPFDATNATNACIREQFSSGGAVAVFDQCRNPNQNHTQLFARN